MGGKKVGEGRIPANVFVKGRRKVFTGAKNLED